MSPQKISRREALKRGAVVGGSVLWATPAVQVLGMGRAFAQTPSDTCVSSWSDLVVSYSPGKRKDGGFIVPPRDEPDRALGAPDNKFVSLGYKGEIILRLAVPYYSGKNGEAIVIETSGGNPPFVEEKAMVSVSGNPGGPWVLAGVATNTNAAPNELKSVIPLDGIAGLPPIVRYVQLVDITNDALHDPASDGYDVNACGVGCP